MSEPPSEKMRASRAPTPWRRARAVVGELGPVVGVLAVLAVTAPALVGFLVLAQATFFAEPVVAWADRHGPAAAALAVLVFGVLTGSALAPTYALSYATGVFFGALIGPIGAVAGVTLGAAVGYFWAMVLARRRVLEVIDANPKAAVVRGALINRSALSELGVVTLLRIPPNSPFALTCLVMSATGVRFPVYLLGTAVGMAPRTVFAALIGAQVGAITEEGMQTGTVTKIVAVALTLGVFVVAYKLFGKWAGEALRKEFGAPVDPGSPADDPGPVGEASERGGGAS